MKVSLSILTQSHAPLIRAIVFICLLVLVFVCFKPRMILNLLIGSIFSGRG